MGPADQWSQNLEKALSAYNSIEHSITGMAPDVAFYCGITETHEAALELGLDPRLLEIELAKHAGRSYSSLKIKISFKIHGCLLYLALRLTISRKI